MPVEVNTFKLAKDPIPSLVIQVTEMVKDPSARIRMNLLEQIIYALWVYWTDTKDVYTETVIKTYQDKLLRLVLPHIHEWKKRRERNEVKVE